MTRPAADRPRRRGSRARGFPRPTGTRRVAVGVCVGLLLAPGAAVAQEQGSSADTVRAALVRQLREARGRLARIRARALSDTALQAERRALERVLREELGRMGGDTARAVRTLQALEDSVRAAREEGDTARLRRLRGRVARLRQTLAPARQAVLRRGGAAAARLDSFRVHLLARMRRIAPATDSLMTRVDSLLSALQGRSPADTTGG